jgi:hypothetical protein
MCVAAKLQNVDSTNARAAMLAAALQLTTVKPNLHESSHASCASHVAVECRLQSNIE